MGPLGGPFQGLFLNVSVFFTPTFLPTYWDSSPVVHVQQNAHKQRLDRGPKVRLVM